MHFRFNKSALTACALTAAGAPAGRGLAAAVARPRHGWRDGVHEQDN